MICLRGDKRLRLKSSVVSSCSETVDKLRVASFTLGLRAVCAPELGISERILLLNSWYDGTNSAGKITVLCDPIIESSCGEETLQESCPCITENRTVTSRSYEIEVVFYDENMIARRRRFKGLKSRDIQHALDHFMGVLLSDRWSRTDQRAKPPLYGYRYEDNSR